MYIKIYDKLKIVIKQHLKHDYFNLLTVADLDLIPMARMTTFKRIEWQGKNCYILFNTLVAK